MYEPNEIDELIERFPRLFRGKRLASRCFLPAGWVPQVHELFEDLNELLSDTDAPQFQIRQIKEKLGGLRVYWWLGPPRLGPDDDGRDARDWYWPELHDRLDARIRAAEVECESICQECGAGAAVRQGRSLNKLCAACWALRTATGQPG